MTVPKQKVPCPVSISLSHLAFPAHKIFWASAFKEQNF